MTTTSTSTDTSRQTANAFADAMNGWTRTWMGTWQQSVDAMFRGLGSIGAPVGAAVGDSNGATPRPLPIADEAFAPLRRQASCLFRGLVDLTALNSAELANLGGEQARFLARISERGFDCVFGPQSAKTTEAFTATAQAMNGDVLENAALVGERLVRMGTHGMERVSELLGGPASSAAKTCCGGACESTATR